MSAKIIQLDQWRQVIQMEKTVRRVEQTFKEIRHGNQGALTHDELTRLLNAAKEEDKR